MASIAEMYCSTVKRDTRVYFAQWMPTASYPLGTVGVLSQGNIFVPKSSLENLGFRNVGVIKDDSPAPLDLQSKQGVKVSFKAAGEASAISPSVPSAKAGVVVEFGREAAYVIQASQSFEDRLADVLALEQEILTRLRAKTWQPHWVVVAQVVRTPKASILISQTKNAKVEVTVEGTVGHGKVAKLGDASLSYGITSVSGKVFNFVDTEGATPLFQLVGLRQNLLGSRVGTLQAGAPAGEVDALDLNDGDDSGDNPLRLQVLGS